MNQRGPIRSELDRRDHLEDLERLGALVVTTARGTTTSRVPICFVVLEVQRQDARVFVADQVRPKVRPRSAVPTQTTRGKLAFLSLALRFGNRR